MQPDQIPSSPDYPSHFSPSKNPLMGYPEHRFSHKSHGSEAYLGDSLSYSPYALLASKQLRESAPLFACIVSGCDYVTKREHDLKRHNKARHAVELGLQSETIDCPYDGCGHKGNHGFKRKDHLRDHCKRYHKTDLPKSMGGTGKSV